MRNVLALQNYWDDPPGYLGEIMEEFGIPYDTVKVDEAPMPDPTGYSAVISLGGPQNANAHEKYPYFFRKKEFLRSFFQLEIPNFAFCLGANCFTVACKPLLS